MTTLSLSERIYFGLIIALAVLSAVNVFLPQGDFVEALQKQELPAPKPVLAVVTAAVMLILYGGLGFVGLRLSQKLGFAGIWSSTATHRQRFVMPALVGVGVGIMFIFTDTILCRFRSLGPLPHPPFPSSLVASATAGIGEEVLFRLFFIPFWVWLFSSVVFKKRWQNQIFWVVSVLSALAFAFGHLPSLMVLFGLKTLSEIPFALMSEMVFLNGVVSLFAAYYFKRYGFLAPVGIHFWTDIVWHVIRGMI